MKGVIVVKVDGGFLMYPRDVIVLQEDVEAGKFTDDYGDSGWVAVKGILEAPPPMPSPPKEEKDDIPF